MANSNVFTLAHLSDTHATPLDGFTLRHWNVKRVLGYLNWQRGRKHSHSPETLAALVTDMLAEKPDHIAVTGDLVNLGLPSEHESARRWLETLGAPEAVTVVPGNHDIYVPLASDPGVGRWAPFMRSNPTGAALLAENPDGDRGFPFVRMVGPLALIGLNSAVPTPPFVAAGRLGAAQLALLAIMLGRARAAGLIRVVLIHHPPLPGQAPFRRALRDAKELERVLTAHGAELVLHGHNHTNTLLTRTTAHGAMSVMGVASASAARAHHGEALARYNLFAFQKESDGLGIDRWRMTLTARGLATPNGEIADVESQTLEIQA